jgi:hypothetical protein
MFKQKIVVCIKRHSNDKSAYFYTTSHSKETVQNHCRELFLMNSNYHDPLLLDEEIGNQLVLYPDYTPISQPTSVDLDVYTNFLG